jgi:hypothetical protein
VTDNEHAEAAELLGKIPVELIDVIAFDGLHVLQFEHELLRLVRLEDLSEEISTAPVVEDEISDQDVRICPALRLREIQIISVLVLPCP